MTESSTSPCTSTVRACSSGILSTVVCEELKLKGFEITLDIVGFKTTWLDLLFGQKGLLLLCREIAGKMYKSLNG